MTFRARLALVAAAAVALAVLAASVVVYFVVRNQLYGDLDARLTEQALALGQPGAMRLEPAVQRIQSRGGKVVFVRFPLAPELETLFGRGSHDRAGALDRPRPAQ